MTDLQPPLSPADLERREQLLQRDGYLLGIALVSLVNGMHFSPLYDLFLVPVAAIAAGFWISSKLVIFYVASLVLSVATIIVAGVPAALYERRRALRDTDVRALQIWLASAFVITLPAFMRMFGGAG
jgi:hypothetical protein